MKSKLKIFNNKLRVFCLCKKINILLVFQFVFGAIVYGQAISKERISFEDQRNSGYIVVKIPIYDDDGYDEYLKGSGSYLKIKVDNSEYTCMEFSSGNQKGASWYWANFTLKKGHCAQVNNTRNNGGWKNIGNSTRVEIDKSGSLSTAEIRYYIPSEWLGKELYATVFLNVAKNGGPAYPDYTANNTHTFTANQNYKAPMVNYNFSTTNPLHYTINGSVSSTTGYSNRFYGQSPSSLNTEFTGTTFSYEVPIRSSNWDEYTYVKYRVSNACGYEQQTTLSTKTTMQGYPLPTNLSATLKSDGKVELTWDMSTLGNQSDYFEIQRADNSGFNNATFLTKNHSVKDGAKIYIDDLAELNLNGIYYYRIQRTPPSANWNWANGCYVSTNVDVNMKHKTVKSAQVALNGNKATVTWELADSTSGIWSKNSKVYINRVNLSAGGSKELIEVPMDSLSASRNKGQYTDELFIMCNKYRYELYVQPGSASYTKADPVSTGHVVPTEQGALELMNASKGYFSERVEIEWLSDGGTINEFIILRREHGSSDAFKQIGKIEGSVASKEYKYDDTYAIPSVVYDYQVRGLVRCADDLIYTDPLDDIGFRTPTGDIYGRITFESGQAVEGVEVTATTEVDIPGKSLEFLSGNTALVSNKDFMSDNKDSISIQAWVSPKGTGTNQLIVSKSGMYELGINDDAFFFKAGANIVTADTLKVSDLKKSSNFIHITGTYSGDSIFIYINGEIIAEEKAESKIISNTNIVQFGGETYVGIIDEVRIWNKVLTVAEIKRDYNRYITGGESNLIGYWNFNYASDKDFYDISYSGSKYNMNHGTVNTAKLCNVKDKNIPITQLAYRGVTAADGSYSIRSIPYVGNGTAYQIVPKMGIHTFESTMEVRNIGLGSQSHTVNFYDKSSFKVSGIVTYANSTIPVEGVNFSIDGKTALKSTGIPYATDHEGKFEIVVPVGIHEVKAVMANHVFVGDGRITNLNGTDRNYQDELLGVRLQDSTTVKIIGRVGGGTIQEAYPLGHSLSTNNLAKDIKVEFKYPRVGYGFGKLEKDSYTDIEEPIEVTEKHLIPSNKTKGYENKVVYGTSNDKNVVTAYVNDTTGEFIVHLIPENFSITVTADGHNSDNIVGHNSIINLKQEFNVQTDIYEYQDSIQTDEGSWIQKNYSDTAYFNVKKKFILRNKPVVRITQVDNSNKALAYFGTDTTKIASQLGNVDTIPLFDGTKYVFGKPVFVQHEVYKFKAEVFESYTHTTTKYPDEVPTQDAKFDFGNGIAGKDTIIECDESGSAYYTFSGGDPEKTGGTKYFTAEVSYGTGGTTIDWKAPDDLFKDGEAFVLGSLLYGTDFITGGPDKVLMVLRDPPGSNSYSYLEKGVSFEESSTYTGSIKNSGSEDFTLGVELPIISWHGVGSGVINIVQESGSGATIGVMHEEEYQGQDTKKTKTTTTTKFETSSDPLYVGANGDVYIGYSTNISFGTTENVTIISRKRFEEAGGEAAYEPNELYYYDKNDPNSKWVMLLNKGISVSQKFRTLFAYPQIHIEDRLIPQIEEIRNSLLLQPGEYNIEDLENFVIGKDTAFYISYFPVDSEHFGKSNTDESLKAYLEENGDKDDEFDGPSYRIIFDSEININDTIVALNQSIENWKKQIAENEKQKVEAKLLQNYSFHAGSSIEYSESYSTAKSHENSFYVMIGGKIANDWKLGAGPAKTKFELTETLETQHGGTFTSEDEASHSKGFVLADEGDDDYITVDVCREKSWSESGEGYGDDLEAKDYYSSFIFKTKGGATSCPYEGEYITKYYEPGQHKINEATMQIEVPVIDMPKKFIENVPSGETAKLQLFLRNNSEIQEDVWFDLKVVDAANPNGARFSIDGGAIGNGRAFLVPAGETLIKTLEVGRGSIMNYDNLKLTLQSQCQADPTTFLDVIADTVTFSVHFTPSCTNVNVRKPTNNWVYNTNQPTADNGGIESRYMDVLLNEFDVNYDNFDHIELQYKSAAQSDYDWMTLMNFYGDSALYKAAKENGMSVEMIKASDAGTIPYRFFMDALPDQYYDIRAVSVCNINNEKITNESEIRSGIKDTYRPRLFGSAQPADGILTVNDEIRLNFNEPIAQGLLTDNNFQVRGVRNGSISDHSVSVNFDGISDFMATEFAKNLAEKDVTVEMWIQPDMQQNATLFSHGDINESMEVEITSNNYLQVKIGSSVIRSANPVPYEQGSWAHVAFVYEASGYLTAYYNFTAVISGTSQVGAYNGIGNFVLGKSIASDGNFYQGKMHNVRVWETPITETNIQINSLVQLSGNETGLVAYYPMDEGKGTLCEDKARGTTMLMNGCKWVMPDGYAVTTNGSSNYLRIIAGTHAVTAEMDYTIEFWFKGEPGQTNATMLSNGNGDGSDFGGSKNYFSIGFNTNGELTYTNNDVTTIIAGEYLDNNWHHFAFSVDRTVGRAQVYMDGNLTTYIDASNIGEVSATYMFLGARGWYSQDNPNVLKVDNHFKGTFDDLRFWELYRNERMISENNNVKLTGEEIGLVHYYPFETYTMNQGNRELDFSYNDMRISSGANEETDSFVIIGSSLDAVKTKDIAPLKDFGPIADLVCDFVVNNDALILTLKEQEYKIAKTIITFTAKDIRDVNGNSIASPITWSAYIDRNQVKWSEDRLNLEKKVYEEMEFTVRAVNSGGSIQRFTINNIPSWLDVTPTSGTLNPSSYEEIRFVVNEGLNVGSYNEVIYLTNEDNVSEGLMLNLTVKGEKPNWTVNPSEYKYNMNVMGKMRFNNIFSADANDMLAAFDITGKCIGVTTSTYNKPFDMWYALLTVYSNEKQNNNIEFRMWDASTGKIYKAIPDIEIVFINDAIYGTVDEPVIFDGKEILYQNIELTKGWNWISFNLKDENLYDVNKTLVNGAWTSQDIIKGKDNFDSYSKNKGWDGTLTRVEGGFKNENMYMLLSSQKQVLSISGTSVDTRITPISVKGKQWNYIGYLPPVNTSVKEALAGYDAQKGDIIKSQNSFAMFSRNEWVGNLKYMEANKGYMLYRTVGNDTEFTYPSVSASLGNKKKSASDEFINTNFSDNMIIVATTDNLQYSDKILAYINGELRAVGECIANEESMLNFITIPGNEHGTLVRFDLERNGSVIGTTYSPSIKYAANSTKGSIDNPVYLDFGIVDDNVSVYPNPFSDKINVVVNAEAGAEIEISIVDILGRVVKQINKQEAHATANHIIIDGSELESGVYLIQITIDNVMVSRKIEKVN